MKLITPSLERFIKALEHEEDIYRAGCDKKTTVLLYVCGKNITIQANGDYGPRQWDLSCDCPDHGTIRIDESQFTRLSQETWIEWIKTAIRIPEEPSFRLVWKTNGKTRFSTLEEYYPGDPLTPGTDMYSEG